MNIVLIVVGAWIALDIAIIAALSHLTRRRSDADTVVGPRSLTPSVEPAARPPFPRTGASPMRLRLVGDPISPAPEPRLRAVSHR